MSTKTPHNEPAFPSSNTRHPNGQMQYGNEGMSLRDYFAAKAMQAIITKLPVIDQHEKLGQSVEDKIQYNQDIAESSYWFADAMLQARETKVSRETSETPNNL